MRRDMCTHEFTKLVRSPIYENDQSASDLGTVNTGNATMQTSPRLLQRNPEATMSVKCAFREVQQFTLED